MKSLAYNIFEVICFAEKFFFRFCCDRTDILPFHAAVAFAALGSESLTSGASPAPKVRWTTDEVETGDGFGEWPHPPHYRGGVSVGGKLRAFHASRQAVTGIVPV